MLWSLGVYFLVLVCRAKKNLATLLRLVSPGPRPPRRRRPSSSSWAARGGHPRHRWPRGRDRYPIVLWNLYNEKNAYAHSFFYLDSGTDGEGPIYSGFTFLPLSRHGC
jgi:hypothetical protein